MTALFFLMLFLLPVLWVITIVMVSASKAFPTIFIVHLAIAAAYLVFVSNYSTIITGYDEKGLKKFFLYLIFIVSHTLLGFAHALYINRKLKRRRTGKLTE